METIAVFHMPLYIAGGLLSEDTGTVTETRDTFGVASFGLQH